MPEQADCIVIGAGAAGLLAGVTLKEANRSVIVLEARDRIGGRAHTVSLSDGTALERGERVVHGPSVAQWEFIARFGLETHLGQLPQGKTAVFRDGEWTLGGDPVIKEAYERIQEVLGVPNPDDISLHDALVAAGLGGEVLEMAERIMYWVSPGASAKHAADAWYSVNGDHGNPNFALVNGYRQLWQELSRPIGDSIRLSTPVTAIQWASVGVVVHSGHQHYEGKTAIITLPVGVLKSADLEFRPALPEVKRAAIEARGMPPLLKVIGEFRRPFWEETIGLVSSLWTYSGHFRSFSVPFWDRPGPPTLSTLMMIEAVREVSGDEDRIRSMFFEALEEMFPGVDLESELVGIVVGDWLADPWSRGGTSEVPVGGFHLRTDLAAPTPPLFWAGEATNTRGNAADVGGALETGRRAAIEVLHALRPMRAGSPETMDWSLYNPRAR